MITIHPRETADDDDGDDSAIGARGFEKEDDHECGESHDGDDDNDDRRKNLLVRLGRVRAFNVGDDEERIVVT